MPDTSFEQKLPSDNISSIPSMDDSEEEAPKPFVDIVDSSDVNQEFQENTRGMSEISSADSPIPDLGIPGFPSSDLSSNDTPLTSSNDAVPNLEVPSSSTDFPGFEPKSSLGDSSNASSGATPPLVSFKE